MGVFVKGDIIVIPFPFSDLSSVKRRPALVIAPVTGDDLILCQITSKYHSDPYSISLHPSDLISGTLKEMSYIRPDKLFTANAYKLFTANAYKLFTANASMIQYTFGHVGDTVIQAVVNTIISIIQQE
ncbi:type II toxin-antitoxin system PemK/MazF family toxin [Methanospirillum hungatei]|uniref:type II toxin-antitoxin system PemK/MazF family toxin n=1 Tax=Methanospirillum hungatei TaxID=2203 RepID=UPI0026EFED3A|nr:type II toxin-antitoxin system PemK/MazF family toxin [Methanospirillum hungatei]MCA1917622.1 type II toxin-antitoxin system PemK/MazF family toxin [Methanospirillum hungatei]